MSARAIPIRVAVHPYIPNRFTHMVAQADAPGRGWLTACPLPLGTWRTRDAAETAARRMQAKGVVTKLKRGAR